MSPVDVDMRTDGGSEFAADKEMRDGAAGREEVTGAKDGAVYRVSLAEGRAWAIEEGDWSEAQAHRARDGGMGRRLAPIVVWRRKDGRL